MTGTARVSGLVAGGFLSLGLGVERLVNAMLVDGVLSYVSMRFFVAVACTAAAGLLFTVAGLRAHKLRHSPRRRPRRYGRD